MTQREMMEQVARAARMTPPELIRFSDGIASFLAASAAPSVTAADEAARLLPAMMDRLHSQHGLVATIGEWGQPVLRRADP